MTKIFLLFNDDNAKSQVQSALLAKKDVEIMDSIGEIDDVLLQINNFMPDIILIENGYNNCEFVIRQLKSSSLNQDTQIILLLNKHESSDVLNLADGFIEYPLNENILISTIESHFKIKKSLDRLTENNKELSRSLYQLNFHLAHALCLN